MGRLDQAKTGAELVKVVLDIVFAVFDRAKAKRDAEQAARLPRAGSRERRASSGPAPIRISMSVDLLDPALTEAWRSSARRRRAIRDHVARGRGVEPARVQLKRRRDGRVAVVVDAPRVQLALPGFAPEKP